MKYLKEKRTTELIVSKSKFIGVFIPINNETLIQDEITKIKKEYPKANHYVYASIIGDAGEYHNSSDDKEPSNTAGIPIMNVLKHQDVTNVLLVVIRYFGGIKLGVGGLSRAYSNVASTAVNESIYYLKKKVPTFKITFKYNLIDKLEHLLLNKTCIIDKNFNEECIYTLHLFETNILDTVDYLLTKKEYLGMTTLEIDLNK